jgi:hypothetical protein
MHDSEEADREARQRNQGDERSLNGPRDYWWQIQKRIRTLLLEIQLRCQSWSASPTIVVEVITGAAARRVAFDPARVDHQVTSKTWDQNAVESRSVSNVIARALWSFWRRGQTVERTGYIVGAVLLVSGLIHLGVLATDGGSWEGPVSLRKAATFGLSFGLTLLTIVWVASFLRLGDRFRSILLGAFTVACAVETALVTLQAWRGVPSHFNLETTFDGLVARILAAGGFVLVAVIATFLLVSFRHHPALPNSLRIAIRIGFSLLFMSLVVGAVMIVKGMRLVFAGNPQAAYATGGALKPTHAATMHAILVLPLLAWLLSFTDWSERRRVAVVWLGAAGYALLAAVIAVENLAGVTSSSTPLAAEALIVFGFVGLLAAGVAALCGVAHASHATGIQHD